MGRKPSRSIPHLLNRGQPQPKQTDWRLPLRERLNALSCFYARSFSLASTQARFYTGWLLYIIVGEAIVEEIQRVVPQFVILRIFHNAIAISRTRKRNREDFVDIRSRAVGHHHQAIG